jgi:hypothetical protein
MEPRGLEPRTHGCKPRVLPVSTKAPCRKTLKRPAGIEPAPQAWHARMLPLHHGRVRAPSGIRTRVAGLRGRHPRSTRRPGPEARTEGIEPSPARGWSPPGRHGLVRTRAPRAGFEPRILRFRAEDPAVRRPRNVPPSHSPACRSAGREPRAAGCVRLRRLGSNQHCPGNSRPSCRLDDVASSGWESYASRRRTTSSTSTPRPCANARPEPTTRKPHFSSTRIDPVLSFAAAP